MKIDNADGSKTVIIGGVGGTYVKVSRELCDQPTLDIHAAVIKFLEGIVLGQDMEIIDTPTPKGD